MPTTGGCSSSAPGSVASCAGARSRPTRPGSRRPTTSCCSPFEGSTPLTWTSTRPSVLSGTVRNTSTSADADFGQEERFEVQPRLVRLRLADDFAGVPLVLDGVRHDVGTDLRQRGGALDDAGLGEADVALAAQLLEQTLQEEKQADRKLTELAEQIVNENALQAGAFK